MRLHQISSKNKLPHAYHIAGMPSLAYPHSFSHISTLLPIIFASTPLFFATSIPSHCRLRMVCLSCSTIDANTSTSILVTISMIHSCPSGTSIIVVGRANAISRIHCFWNHSSSALISALDLDNRSRLFMYNVSPLRSPSDPFSA